MTPEQINRHLQAYKTAYLVEATGLDYSTVYRHRNGGKMSLLSSKMWTFFLELEKIKAQKKTLLEAFEIKSSSNS